MLLSWRLPHFIDFFHTFLYLRQLHQVPSGASPSLAWMQREPGAWWTGAANAHTSQVPSVLKDGGHLGRILCWQKKRWISPDIVLPNGGTWLWSGYIANCFHERNWEVVKSPVRVGEWFIAVKKTLAGSFGRYLQDVEIKSPFLHTLTLKQGSSSIEGTLILFVNRLIRNAARVEAELGFLSLCRKRNYSSIQCNCIILNG